MKCWWDSLDCLNCFFGAGLNKLSQPASVARPHSWRFAFSQWWWSSSLIMLMCSSAPNSALWFVRAQVPRETTMLIFSPLLAAYLPGWIFWLGSDNEDLELTRFSNVCLQATALCPGQNLCWCALRPQSCCLWRRHRPAPRLSSSLLCHLTTSTLRWGRGQLPCRESSTPSSSSPWRGGFICVYWITEEPCTFGKKNPG